MEKKNTDFELFYFRCRICPQLENEGNSVRADRLEKIVFELLKEKLETEESDFKSTEETKDTLLKQISELEMKKDLSYEKFKLGKISREKFISLKSRYDREIEILKDSLLVIPQRQANYTFTKLTREIVQENIKSIYVRDGKITEIEYVD